LQQLQGPDQMNGDSWNNVKQEQRKTNLEDISVTKLALFESQN
jgi:hypothetical protein